MGTTLFCRAGGAALVDMLDAVSAAKRAGATEEQLRPVLELHRKAQWRLDFVAAENSMGFHAPQELARILEESIDLSRQGQIAPMRAGGPGAFSPAPVPAKVAPPADAGK